MKRALRSIYCSLLWLTGFLLVWAATASAATPLRYLFLVDTSAGLADQAEAIAAALATRIRGGLDGQMRAGDTVTVWTFAEGLSTNAHPVVVWHPQTKDSSAAIFARALREQRFQGTARLNEALDHVAQVGGPRESLTIYIISDGLTAISGTDFDANINASYKRFTSTKGHRLLGTTLLVRDQELVGWSVESLTRNEGQNSRTRERQPAPAIVRSTNATIPDSTSGAKPVVSAKALPGLAAPPVDPGQTSSEALKDPVASPQADSMTLATEVATPHLEEIPIPRRDLPLSLPPGPVATEQAAATEKLPAPDVATDATAPNEPEQRLPEPESPATGVLIQATGSPIEAESPQTASPRSEPEPSEPALAAGGLPDRANQPIQEPAVLPSKPQAAPTPAPRLTAPTPSEAPAATPSEPEFKPAGKGTPNVSPPPSVPPRRTSYLFLLLGLLLVVGATVALAAFMRYKRGQEHPSLISKSLEKN